MQPAPEAEEPVLRLLVDVRGGAVESKDLSCRIGEEIRPASTDGGGVGCDHAVPVRSAHAGPEASDGGVGPPDHSTGEWAVEPTVGVAVELVEGGCRLGTAAGAASRTAVFDGAGTASATPSEARIFFFYSSRGSSSGRSRATCVAGVGMGALRWHMHSKSYLEEGAAQLEPLLVAAASAGDLLASLCRVSE